jgi:hypothetical protein
MQYVTHTCCAGSDKSLKPDGIRGANGWTYQNVCTGLRMDSLVFIIQLDEAAINYPRVNPGNSHH